MSAQSSQPAPVPPRPFFAALRAARSRWGIFAAILAFCFFSKVIRLSVPPELYFDEVYHAFTAKSYLHGAKEAYNPWAESPKDMAFEWTHPPLSKLIMAGSMRVFGETPFGWRIGSVVFGTAATVATAAWAFELFGSLEIALLAMGLMSLETLVFAQSRIAMNDTYLLFFALLTLLYYTRWKHEPGRLGPLYLSGIALGLALGTKWTTLYLILILMIDQGGEFIWHGRIPKKSTLLHLGLAFGVIPALLYLASYTQYFWLGYGWSDFVKLQGVMWNYHNSLSATHEHSSVPWQWLLNLRPVWMHVNYSVPGRIGNIYNIGNSVILYTGLYAIYRALFREGARERSWEKGFVLLVYFGLWLPWSFSPRVMFFYHYIPAIPALCILLARWLEAQLRDPGLGRPRVARIILAGALLWFVVFYPNLTDVPVPQGLADVLYFGVPGWK